MATMPTRPGSEAGERDDDVVGVIAPPPPDERSVPKLDEAAFHGPVGELVRLIEPHSEADPIALLVTALVALGNLVGPNPHMIVEGDRHPARLNAVLVGTTAKARKGTSWGRIRSIMEMVDDRWSRDRVKSGLVSGEGLIENVRDTLEGEDSVDHRLLLVESEFASLLRVMDRLGNTLSPTIRNLWDHGNAQTLARTKNNNAIKTTAAHVSIVGHVTRDELLRFLTGTEMANGFANRFLWVQVERSKVLPFGGELHRENISPMVDTLRAAVSAARRILRVAWSPAAGEMWAAMYESLSAGKPGMIGAMTNRAEAQAVRLALTYAVLDGSSTIEPAHLRAALAVLIVVQRSVTEIFAARTGNPDADRIGRILRENGGPIGRTELSRALGNNMEAWRISLGIEALEKLSLARTIQNIEGARVGYTWVGP